MLDIYCFYSHTERYFNPPDPTQKFLKTLLNWAVLSWEADQFLMEYKHRGKEAKPLEYGCLASFYQPQGGRE